MLSINLFTSKLIGSYNPLTKEFLLIIYKIFIIPAASKVMAGANKSMNIHHVQKTMANYQKESELAGIRNELSKSLILGTF
jgi:hypothetical protein